MKPIAAGAELIGGEWINEDAARLRSAGSFDPGLTLLNPVCLKSPIAPHIAAAEEGIVLEDAPILEAYRALCAQADAVFVEGVGGFRVPLGPDHDTADLAVAFGLPVILVIGMRLGCINHALLTAEAMLRFEQNVQAVAQRIDAPMLGEVRYDRNADPAAVTTLCLPA